MILGFLILSLDTVDSAFVSVELPVDKTLKKKHRQFQGWKKFFLFFLVKALSISEDIRINIDYGP